MCGPLLIFIFLTAHSVIVKRAHMFPWMQTKFDNFSEEYIQNWYCWGSELVHGFYWETGQLSCQGGEGGGAVIFPQMLTGVFFLFAHLSRGMHRQGTEGNRSALCSSQSCLCGLGSLCHLISIP